MERRLRIDRSGPFFTAFLTHSGAMGLQIRQKLSSLGPILASDAISQTGCQVVEKIAITESSVIGCSLPNARLPAQPS